MCMMLCFDMCACLIPPSSRQTSTYDHRLKRTGHLVRSAIHKLDVPDTLNRADRHSVQSEPLTTLMGEARVSRVNRLVTFPIL